MIHAGRGISGELFAATGHTSGKATLSSIKSFLEQHVPILSNLVLLPLTVYV